MFHVQKCNEFTELNAYVSAIELLKKIINYINHIHRDEIIKYGYVVKIWD